VNLRGVRAWWSRLTAGLALVMVASVTGVISYTHVYDLTVSLHQPVMVARLMPFGVDGLIVVGSVVLLQAAPGQTWLGWLGVIPGVAASLSRTWSQGCAGDRSLLPGPECPPRRSPWPPSCSKGG
jgi:Protein of unknown function (DUF2637)